MNKENAMNAINANTMTLDKDREVLRRYAAASKAREEALCCPTQYDTAYLKVLPREILERDYGCGDPTPYVREGETVLDLGSGSGKTCYILSQVVGPKGCVIGVDFNPDMLALAEGYRAGIARRIGWDNVTFRRARIQDLRTDIPRLEARIAEHPIATYADYDAFEAFRHQAMETPLVADDSVDVIVSNCVLNLVHPDEKKDLFREMYRVLKVGGRVAISDIVSDEEVPAHLREDAELWSGCVSGAFQESAFLRAFEEAGFHGIAIEKRDAQPWRTVEGIEFRAMTVTAHKGKEGACWERHQAVIYKGPWREVRDDDGHVLRRGVSTAVCDKTYRIFTSEPYRNEIFPVSPRVDIPLEKATPFDCARAAPRHPRETKGMGYAATTDAAPVCGPGGNCC